MPISDIEILDLLIMETLVADLDTAELRCRGRVLKPFLIGADVRGPHGRRYGFGLRISGRRRTIVRAKLVYMAGTLDLVPEGFEIHHLNEDRHDDRFENLVMLRHVDHQKIHNQYDQNPWGDE